MTTKANQRGTINVADLYPHGELDADALVEEFFAYDGPHDAETITTALAVAARLIRYANNATQNPRRLRASDVSTAVGSLHSVAALMPQLLDQLGVTLETAAAESTTLYDDRRDPKHPAADVARQAAAILRTGAVAAVGNTAAALQMARSLTLHLGHPAEPDPNASGDDPSDEMAPLYVIAEGSDQLAGATVLALLEHLPAAAVLAACQSDAWGALLHHIRQHVDARGAEPAHVIGRIHRDDLAFAARADNPAAYLAAKVRDI